MNSVHIKPKRESYTSYAAKVRYLHATKDKGIIYRHTIKDKFQYHFAWVSIAWASKLQTEVTLRTTEAVFIALSEGLRSTTPLIGLVKEFSGCQ